MGKKVLALLIHLCVTESIAQHRDYVMNCHLWFCHGRTWGLCSPSELWGSPWPAATYRHRTAGPSVTGQLTGKGRDGLCSYWARLTKEDYRTIKLLIIPAILYSSSLVPAFVESLDTFCFFLFVCFLNLVSKNGYLKDEGAMRLPEINLLILTQLVNGEAWVCTQIGLTDAQG